MLSFSKKKSLHHFKVGKEWNSILKTKLSEYMNVIKVNLLSELSTVEKKAKSLLSNLNRIQLHLP